jgi:hypothetical protein
MTMTMTMPLPLTLLFEPPRRPPGPQQIGADDFAPLAAALSAHLFAAVPLVQGYLRDTRPAGLILLHAELSPQAVLAECPEHGRTALAARLIPLAVSEKGVCEMLEALGLPAAVSNFGLSQWQAAEPGETGASGIYGLRNLARASHARIDTLRGPVSPRYGHLVSKTHHGLPHLLADYLRVLAATLD